MNPVLHKQVVGILMYLIATRSNIMCQVSLISKFMESCEDSQWKIGKGFLWYIADRVHHGILHTTSKNNSLIEYKEIKFLGIIDEKKSHLAMFCI